MGSPRLKAAASAPSQWCRQQERCGSLALTLLSPFSGLGWSETLADKKVRGRKAGVQLGART